MLQGVSALKSALTALPRRRLLAAGGLIAAVAAVAVFLRASSDKPLDRALPVAVVPARVSDTLERVDEVPGLVTAAREATLGFERSGTISEILVRDGARVTKGQALARLEASQLEAMRREAEAALTAGRANLKEAEARLALARTTLERQSGLSKSANTSRQAFETAQAEASAAEARREAMAAAIDSQKAILNRIQVDIDRSTIVAPFDGVIAAKLLDEGNVVSASQPILRIIEDQELEFRAGLPLTTGSSLEVGSRHTVVVGANEVPAVLASLVPELGRSTRTMLAVFKLEGAAARELIGMTGRVRVVHRSPEPGSWVPVDALSEARRGLWSVFVLVADAEGGAVAERREVQLLHVQQENAFVRGAIRDKDQIIATGVHRLVPGQAVRLAPEMKAAK